MSRRLFPGRRQPALGSADARRTGDRDTTGIGMEPSARGQASTVRLPLRRSWAWALAACALAAAAEGALAGPDVGRRFSEIALPPLSPPLWLWGVSGGLYYMLFFFLLKSLLETPPTPRLTSRALVLVALMLASNAAWNWLFFRERDLWLSAAYGGPYAVIALLLGRTLWQLRSPMFRWFALYLAYFGYAAWWGIALWRVNAAGS